MAQEANDEPMVCPEHALEEEHAGHANHLCELTARRQMAKVARLSKDAKYVCHICGRAAADHANLCEAVRI